MNSIFITGGVISFVYLVFKFLEMRFVLKEKKPMKVLFRDTLIVYISVVLGWTVFLNSILLMFQRFLVPRFSLMILTFKLL